VGERYPYTFVFLFCLGILLFLIAAVVHDQVEKKLAYNKALLSINQGELAKITGELQNHDSGLEFADPHHGCAEDLHLFGTTSLFAYLSHCQTHQGRLQLADALKNVSEISEIQTRHAIINELAPQIEWRQRLQALARVNPNSSKDLQFLVDWAESEQGMGCLKILIIPALLSPLLFLTILGLGWLGILPWGWAYLLGGLHFIFIGLSEKKVRKIYQQTSNCARVLRTLEEIFRHIEMASFTNPQLQEIQNQFKNSSWPASRSIRRLSSLLAWLDLRRSMVHFPINLIFLFDYNLSCRLEKFRMAHAGNLREWLYQLGYLEMLASLAVLPYENPDWQQPQIKVGDFSFSAKKLGHLLIPESTRITNDFSFDKGQWVEIVSGSNMAGKSTFLRTVGTAVVLAGMGASVPAEEITLTPRRVFAAMSSRDSLEQGISSFRAELERIKQILEEVSSGQKMLILLDEMLKGTNSKDRHLGSKSLILQLMKENIPLITATHDLELAHYIASLSPECVRNHSFNGRVEGEELFFEYKLEEGICNSLNAVPLMKKMGIKIQE
jgi:hypothetical protein